MIKKHLKDRKNETQSFGVFIFYRAFSRTFTVPFYPLWRAYAWLCYHCCLGDLG